MQTRIYAIPAALVITLLAGCASTVSAPVRDVNGLPPAVSAVPAEQPGMHTVRPGETLLGIARQYGVTLPDLVGWNNISDPNQLAVGQTVRVAPPGVDGTAVATAIPIGDGAVATPVPAPGAESPAAAPLKQGPVGGRQPYSEEAWSKASPAAAAQPAVPPPVATTPDVPRATGSGEWQWPAGG
ncbi:LysM domain-containing protein, partial [Thauera sp.]